MSFLVGHWYYMQHKEKLDEGKFWRHSCPVPTNSINWRGSYIIYFIKTT